MSGKFNVLVADDEKEIRNVLSLLLSCEGYNVICASDGNEVVSLANENIDLYILDVNMPNLDGFMTAATIRKKYDAPIIFLTAYSTESEKIMGFTVGADDYIVKPFSNIELLMRVKAILKRSIKYPENTGNKNIKRINDIILDMDKQVIIKDETIISLTYTEYKIIELLANNPKHIYSLDDIYQSIWNDNAVGDDAIMVHIKNIRKKINDDSRNPKYIKTAWGRGYYVE